MLSVELFFLLKSLSSIFPRGTDLLVPFSDFEQHLAEVLLSQPEKMASTEDTRKKMQERAKKRKTPQAATTASSPLSSLPAQAEKKKEVGPNEGRQKEKQSRRETIDMDVEPTSVNFPSKTSL